MSGQTGVRKSPDDNGGRLPGTPQPAAAAQQTALRHVRSTDLFGGAREVVIEHDHHRYRLKMTSRGGLILNK
jgi:hemin uptake protein HemP